MLFAGIDIAKYDHVIGAVDERGLRSPNPCPSRTPKPGLASSPPISPVYPTTRPTS